MSTNNFFKTSLPSLHNVVQNSMILYPKEVILSTLRDYFSKDDYYHYSKDAWGFPNTTDNTNLPLDAGMNDNVTTRVFIGENYRQDIIFYPGIFVKLNSSRYIPLSINQEDSTVDYGIRSFDDGYGNISFYKYPKSFIFAGIWESSISIDVKARNPRTRDELLQEISICITNIYKREMERIGLICKPLSVGSPSEQEDRTGKLHTQTITFDVRTEWRREIPIENIVEAINFSIEFANLENPEPIVAENLTINMDVDFLDIMSGKNLGIKVEKI